MSNWLHINPTSGRGSTQMTISADTNDTPDVRKAKIIITAGTLSKTIEVVQYPTAGEITCTYKVPGGMFRLSDKVAGLSRVVVYADNGNSLTYSGGDEIGKLRDYGSLLDVQEGDVITAQFYTTNHYINQSMFTYIGEVIPVKTITISDSIIGLTGSTTDVELFFRLPELETVHFGHNMVNYYSNIE